MFKLFQIDNNTGRYLPILHHVTEGSKQYELVFDLVNKIKDLIISSKARSLSLKGSFVPVKHLVQVNRAPLSFERSQINE